MSSSSIESLHNPCYVCISNVGAHVDLDLLYHLEAPAMQAGYHVSQNEGKLPIGAFLLSSSPLNNTLIIKEQMAQGEEEDFGVSMDCIWKAPFYPLPCNTTEIYQLQALFTCISLYHRLYINFSFHCLLILKSST